MANRIELRGRIIDSPELRVTPAGTPILRLTVECGDGADSLALPVVMTGSAAAELARQLRRDAAVEVQGALRRLNSWTSPGAAAFEVLAAAITLGRDAGENAPG